MLQDGSLKPDFRFRGFPNQSMQSPRQPITTSPMDDKRRSEENFVKVFGRSSMLDPVNPGKMNGTSRGFQYGYGPVDNNPKPRGISNPFSEKSPDGQWYRQLKNEADEDILKFKEEKMREDKQREEARRRGDDNRRRKFLETDSPTGGPQAGMETPKPPKGHDLFVNTLGGPGGTVVRQDGGPGLQSLSDPRVGAYRPAGPPAQDREAELAVREREIDEQKHRIADLKKQLEMLKSPRGPEPQREQGYNRQDRYNPNDTRYEPSFGSKESVRSRPQVNFDLDERPVDKRSLDLEASRGGAGAPLKDDRGKTITRFPNTMGRDDYGAAKIQERIPGKSYRLPSEPEYNPFGRPGGGAPMVDRYGQRNTHTFGNFERKIEASDLAKKARAQEQMQNELRTLMDEQQNQRERERLYQKIPDGDLADLIRSKEVGRPRLDPITGTLANQHLPNSDVSRVDKDSAVITRNGSDKKMNYQPKEEQEKRQYKDALEGQMQERERTRGLEKLQERNMAQKHYQEMDQTWGGYGGGAPKDRVVRKKVNLDNALYHYDSESVSEEKPRARAPPQNGPQLTGTKTLNPSYQKRFFEEDIRHVSPDVTPRYVRNTTKSTSKNLYEYPQDKSPRPVQRTVAPWATGSAEAY